MFPEDGRTISISKFVVDMLTPQRIYTCCSNCHQLVEKNGALSAFNLLQHFLRMGRALPILGAWTKWGNSWSTTGWNGAWPRIGCYTPQMVMWLETWWWSQVPKFWALYFQTSDILRHPHSSSWLWAPEGEILLDLHVCPRSKLLDCRTHITGIKEEADFVSPGPWIPDEFAVNSPL